MVVEGEKSWTDGVSWNCGLRTSCPTVCERVRMTGSTHCFGHADGSEITG